MAENSNGTYIRIGPSGSSALTIVFVLLKVFGYIDWSWWWVFSPIWGGLALFLFILSIMAIIVALLALVE